METTEKETKEGSTSPSAQQTTGPGQTMSCPMCGACGEGKSPMEEMIGKGPMAMMQKMPAMCMAFMVVTSALLGVVAGLMIGRGTSRAR